MISLLGFGWLVRQLLYPVPPVPVPSPPPDPLEEVRLQVGQGPEVVAWYLPAARPGAPAALFFHGNGENLETMRQAGLFRELEALGIHALAPDYPGYGRSGGRPSEGAILEAAEAAWRWLGGRHPGAPKVLSGWSLGAAVAVQLAARYPEEVDGLVLMSAWTSLEEVASAHFPRFLVRLMVDEGYDSLAAAPGIRCPVLAVHGAGDGIVPAAQGRRLAAALGEGTRWVEVPGAGHNDLLGRPEVWEAVATFLESLQGSPP